MTNRIKQMKSVETEAVAITIEGWLAFFERDRVFFDADYQRDYVWTEKEQQQFLTDIASGLPMGAVAVVKEKDSFVYELVDGKQRLTTLKMFFNDQISLKIGDDSVKFSELTQAEQFEFLKADLPMVRLKNASRKQRLEYFLKINFSGVPQSKEHQEKVQNMFKNA